ncbi:MULTISPECIES: thiolase family protein [Nocardia]|uniref:thiolase family protein n=1 Tax=Nocardia TaxID=1817 RepID=UPI000D6949F7|nr:MULTISPECIES: thiolase family protein [Nocardia]
MPEAVIVSACRTAIGTAFKGSLVATSAFDLAEAVVAESVVRSGIAPARFDEVILGESLAGGGNIARHTAVRVGLTAAPGLAQNRHCASGLAAVQTAAAGIRAGVEHAIIAGGVESASTMPVMRVRVPGNEEWLDKWLPPSHPDSAQAPNRDMSITVGWNTARALGLSREDMDAWALRSHERAIDAIDAGHFADEIVPVKVTLANGTEVVFDTDEHPRRGTTAERLAALKPLHPEIDGFSITAGNSSGINDAAAAVVVTSREFAEHNDLTPLAVVRSWANVGVDPTRTGLAPSEAIPKALERGGLTVDDVSLFEVNEAFAAVPLATARLLDLDPEIMNVSGSGCSLGHPVAATGARMVATMLGDLRRRGGGIGVVSMCAGGGMGAAMVIESC